MEQAVANGAVFTTWEQRLYATFFAIPIEFGRDLSAHFPYAVDPKVIEAAALKMGYSSVEYKLRPSGEGYEQIIRK